MVRHKKDNYSRGGKKFSSTPRPRPVPRGDGESSDRLPFKAACWDLGHCDPKRCSGKRLMHLGLMRELGIGQKYPGVVVSYVNLSFFLIPFVTSYCLPYITSLFSLLQVNSQDDCSPNAKKIISPADRDILEQYGAAVVECSWVRLKEVPFSRIGGKCERLRMLPFKAALIGGIDIHTNKPSTLSRCSQHSQLRTAMAVELCRSPGGLFLYLRTRRLG